MTVRFHGNVIGCDATMPQRTKRRHESAKYGDTEAAIARSSGQCLDFNQVTVVFNLADGRRRLAVSGHWGVLGRDGYTHTTVGPQRGLRPLTKAERRMSYQAWTDRHGGTAAALQTLRKRGRRRGPLDQKPLTWAQAVRIATRENTVLIPELKSIWFQLRQVADYMVSVCASQNYPLWPMTLIWMRKAEEKVDAFREAGSQIAVIFGNRRRLAFGRNLVARWDREPTRVWGPGPAARWV